jgi:hypothetical protein
MRGLVIASALFSVLLFIVSGALARASHPAVAVVRPSRHTDVVRLADRARPAAQAIRRAKPAP